MKILSALILALIFVLAGYLIFDFSRPTPTPSPLPIFGQAVDYLSSIENLDIREVTDDLPGARVIAFDPKGGALISQTSLGKVVLLYSDRPQIGSKIESRVLLEGLNKPHGLAFYMEADKIYLYVALSDEVVRFEYNSESQTVDLNSRINIANLPDGGRHFTRTILFGPNYREAPILDGFREQETLSQDKLYISVGSSCDTCLEDNWKRAAVLESDPIGNFTAEFAGGLRNSVFMAINPRTGELWATEMGRDDLGDNLPPDEINILRVGEKYGWPFCFGDKVQDETFAVSSNFSQTRIDIPRVCGLTEAPVINLPAHVAPLGLAFIPASWPEELRGDLIVALHGSWNSSEQVGYEIIRFNINAEGQVEGGSQPFIAGFLNNGEILGRPVDLKFDADGALYISDDSQGKVFRVIPGEIILN
ncbi:MAG: hypothetical protein COV31_03295 [Candidatus Yanofskybacteria bacterium CG10_big_fil_rev_8_21_14_0_10_46_23]|uniref:Pyrroloquinoline quinone-dependent pyranose dehydrogenase beta-propeller domain-containing protein n=1 Tax=Candidatus Yanofskybacteria bacterium CG10_big_fil_rev_8_21_14_0_10_46_23 TaxID=1975098 RepID=A0A2H0R3H2_9BACT|nr:MAG: hypothetical protein COV31_03295 [Candidatus Yanofskybacteria bacterium CG10_big_fil_rev_8_21_14_0_10_46_23]